MPDKTETGTATEERPAAQEDDRDVQADVGPRKAHSPDPKDEEDDKGERRKTEDRSEGPQPNSPRWNEIYGRYKATERKLQEREADIDAIREHNKALEARLNSIETSKADKPADPEPDPEIDPAGYKKWVEFQAARQKQEFEKQRAIDRHTTQVEIQKEMHEDYTEMAKIAERDMAKDQALNKRIWGAENPAKAAYEYGRKKAKDMDDETRETSKRQKAKEQTDTESAGDAGGETEEEGGDKLSAAEERVVRNLFPDMKYDDAKKKYLKQKKAMGV